MLLDALWWIGVISVGVALGLVLGDWVRRGALVPPGVYYGLLIALTVGYVAFLYFAWRIGWIPMLLLWIRSLGPAR